MTALIRLAAPVVALLVSCGSSPPAAEPPRADRDCPDLSFSAELYDEWRAVRLPDVTEELGDARYPACNDVEPGNGPDLDGFGATDVWRLPGVDPANAIIGYRQGGEIPVIFVHRGLDPAQVLGLDSGTTASAQEQP